MSAASISDLYTPLVMFSNKTRAKDGLPACLPVVVI